VLEEVIKSLKANVNTHKINTFCFLREWKKEKIQGGKARRIRMKKPTKASKESEVE
jgi:hypothetical protein